MGATKDPRQILNAQLATQLHALAALLDHGDVKAAAECIEVVSDYYAREYIVDAARTVLHACAAKIGPRELDAVGRVLVALAAALRAASGHTASPDSLSVREAASAK